MANPLNSNINDLQFNNMPINGITPQMQQGINNIKNIMNMIKTSSNPQIMMQQMIQSNPQMAQVAQLVQGNNPETVFREMCKQRGINADEFINMLK